MTVAPTERPTSTRRPAGASTRPSASAFVCLLAAGMSPATALENPPDRGNPAMNEPGRQPLLATYYEQLDRDGDLDAFRAAVESRYSEGTLCRLVHANDVRARRSAVIALGLSGGWGCNASLASALADDDPIVRDQARKSLWAVWYRADSPENNDRLRSVAELIGRGLLDDARRAASDLIRYAPGFAEAYNQRAIAHFFSGRFAESADDCRRVLELNPYHVGALDGLAGSYLKLGRPDLALETYRRALKLQPHSEALRRTVESLESGPR
ncbi:tetratricopeptide repeat protein [Tautonia plasticadhaerens]|uniref:Tetratricopeptide repeat protein n=1 Tax=Tautonia plasticadhaerens TaxID=2527974 RepID=A0A518HAI0_9BACT|nr:tetratricopeptide repeat protein [Tautonia plasticadhaerens]QDV37862.1 Tetratricopeptide repeat protein [Tautonia plasticadhaerens]